MYQVIRLQKLKTKNEISHAISHNLRLNTDNLSNIDKNKEIQNEYSYSSTKKEFETNFNQRIEFAQSNSKKKIRSDAVQLIHVVITCTPEFFKLKTENEKNYFKDSEDFLVEKFGSENIVSLAVHRDEKTPHMHALIVPIDEKGILSAKRIIGGPSGLRKLQTNFNDKVGKRFGLKRGEVGSSAKHETVKEYHRKINKHSKRKKVDIKEKMESISVFKQNKAEVISEINTDFENIERELFLANQEIERLQLAKNIQESYEMHAEYAQMQQENENLRSDIAKLTSSNLALKEGLRSNETRLMLSDNLKQSHATLRAKYDELDNSNQYLRGELSATREELKQEKLKVKGVGHELLVAKNKNSDLNFYINTIREELTEEASEKLVVKDKEITDLKLKLTDRDSKLDEYKQRNLKLFEKNNELEERLNPSKSMDMGM